jgi:hypothetical protein
MTSGWLTLSGRPATSGDATTGAVALVLECTLPIVGPTVLIDWQGPIGVALSVFADPRGGLAVLIRQGDRVARHRMSGPLPLPPSGIMRMTLTSDPGAGRWSLRIEAPGTAHARTTRGRDPLPLGPFVAMTAKGAGLTCHPSVLWFGLARGDGMPQPDPWIGPATPVDTPQGSRAAATLRAGDIVTTLAGPRPLAGITPCETPVSGSLAPVRLRAPWFADSADLIVSHHQPVMLAGVAVEYLFGEDAVLAEAGMLAGDTAAIRDARPGVLIGLSLALAPESDPLAAVILADGCALPVAGCRSMRWLAAYEAVPLRLHLGPGLRARAA